MQNRPHGVHSELRGGRTVVTSTESRGPSRQFCYIVMSHTDAPGMLRLVRRIRELSPTASVLVRCDRPEYVSGDEVTAAGGQLHISAIPVRWGGWSQVRAIIEAMVFASSDPRRTHFVVISGQDWPVRDLAAWEAEVTGDALLAMSAAAPHPHTFQYRWYEPRPAPRWLPAFADDFITRVVRRLQPRVVSCLLAYRDERSRNWFFGWRRRSRSPLPIRKSSSWMVLSSGALEYVVDRYARDEETLRFFSHVRCADEIYIPTLLHDQRDLVLQEGSTSYSRFEAGAASPVWATRAEVERGRACGSAFVRKVTPGDEATRRHADALVARG